MEMIEFPGKICPCVANHIEMQNILKMHQKEKHVMNIYMYTRFIDNKVRYILFGIKTMIRKLLMSSLQIVC